MFNLPSNIKSCFDAQTSLQDSSSRPLQHSSMNAARSTDPVQAPKRTEGRRPKAGPQPLTRAWLLTPSCRRSGGEKHQC